MSARLFRRAVRTWLALLGGVVLAAHVGSPDTIWDGSAGPYPIRVIIRDPGVVPGQAEVIVRAAGSGIAGVAVTSIIWNSNGRAAPPPDVAVRVPGDSTLWTTHVWFMAASSYAVKIMVTGARGTATAMVPFVARASRVANLPSWLGGALAVLAGLLLAGLITIVMTSVRESVVAPGEAISQRRRQMARVAGLVTAAAAVVVVWLGRSWWGDEARAYAQGVIATNGMRTTASITHDGDQTLLTLSIDDSSWHAAVPRTRGSRTPLIPDEGKLMHTFVVSESGDGFAHLHPLSIDSTHFRATLPPLPPGRYRVFSDIVHESGWNETLLAEMTIGAAAAEWHATDVDDAWTPATATTDSIATLDDGSRMIWHRGASPIIAGQDARLRFSVVTAAGEPDSIAPFLGMAGHAVVVRDDGGVYVHLHPMGTAPMASQLALSERTDADSTPGLLGSRLTKRMVMADTLTMLPGNLEFPYQFPAPGRYRVWVQVRHRRSIATVAYRIVVTASLGVQ